MTIRYWAVLLIFMGALLMGGCTSPGTTSISSPSSSVAETTTDTTKATSSASTSASVSQVSNAKFSNLPRLDGKATVVMVVKGGPITIEVDGTDAPITSGNFVDLVQRGVYNGLVFHRVVREPQPFVVQGGDPQGKDPKFPISQLGTGGFVDPVTSQPRYIPLEIKPKGADKPVYSKTFETAGLSTPPQLPHTRGAVAMARSQLPDSASSQFYIALADLGFLDGSYAVFGKVTQGMEVVDQIKQGDRIQSAKVTQGIENLKTSK